MLARINTFFKNFGRNPWVFKGFLAKTNSHLLESNGNPAEI
jgi:hypothetical protein